MGFTGMPWQQIVHGLKYLLIFCLLAVILTAISTFFQFVGRRLNKKEDAEMPKGNSLISLIAAFILTAIMAYCAWKSFHWTF